MFLVVSACELLTGWSKRLNEASVVTLQGSPAIYSSHLSSSPGWAAVSNTAAFIVFTTHNYLFTSALSSTYTHFCAHFLHMCILNTVTLWLTAVASHSQNSRARGGVDRRGSASLAVCIYKERVRTSSLALRTQWLLGQSALWLWGDTQQGLMLLRGREVEAEGGSLFRSFSHSETHSRGISRSS